MRDDSLNSRVIAFLGAAKGDQSLGDFAATLRIPKQSLHRYLRGENSMTLATLDKIAAALGVTIEQMLKSNK